MCGWAPTGEKADALEVVHKRKVKKEIDMIILRIFLKISREGLCAKLFSKREF